ncbi:MAG: glycosyltransferase [Alphaproteobacteria bacterium]|nr:glycosyltransferase [Alphaproteobacteria bacterium]
MNIYEWFALAAATTILAFAVSQGWLALKYLMSPDAAEHIAEVPRQIQQFPSVLIQLPIYNEGRIVERLLEFVSRLNYPADKLSIQLLDDSTDETTQIAAIAIKQIAIESGLQIQHVRRGSRQGYKAGAMAHGLGIERIPSELVAVFDADFAPNPDFLLKTVPLFNDPRVGMVQTRWQHQNANQNIVTRLMSMAIDNHFVVEHGGRQAAGCFINFNGTAGVWRSAAISNAGGWSSDSLTEDLDLSFRAQMAGWKCVYLPTVQTPSELPANLSDLRTQQFRWTKGALEAAQKLIVPLWQSSASIQAKVFGSLQLLAGIQFPCALIFGLSALAFHYTYPNGGIFAYQAIADVMLVATLSVSFSFLVTQWALGQKAPRQLLGAFLKVQVFMLFAVGFAVQNTWAVTEAIFHRKTEFIRTPKAGGNALNAKNNLSLPREKKIPKYFYVEIVLALLFSMAAVREITQWRSTILPLFGILAGNAIGFGVMSTLTLREFFGYNGDVR